MDLDRARRHALTAQVRAGLDLLARGLVEESLRIRRVVLRDDPANARAQAAVQQVRNVWLTRQEFAEALGSPASTQDPPAERPKPAHPALAVAAPRREPLPRAPAAAARDASRVPVEIRLPATRLRATPIALVLGCGAVIVAALGWLMFGGRAPRHPLPPPVVAEAMAPPALEPASVETEPASVETRAARAPPSDPTAPGPWSDAPPELRAAAESRLTAYARALETADEQLLAVARPDLSAGQRKRALEPFLEAVNAAADLRVVRVAAHADAAEVVVQRSDVIVDGPRRPPVEETLRFKLEGGEWVLR